MKKLMVIAALLVFMTGSAYAAAEWNFYGSARVSTFYTKFDGNFLDIDGGGNPFAGSGPDTSNFEMDNNGNARIGARIKVSDTLSARFEYGAKSGDVNLRILWGEWNFGAGSLGVGQHYTPLLMPYSNQVYNIYAMEDGDTNMSLFGMLYGKREPMIRLKFGNFQIAAVKPRQIVARDYTYSGTPEALQAEANAAGAAAGAAYLAANPGDFAGAAAAGAAAGQAAGAAYITDNTDAHQSQPDSEVKLPNIQAKYKFDFDWGHVNLAAGYQTFEVAAGGEEYDVDSYVLAVGGRLNLGKAYFKGNLWGGQNVGNLADIFVNGSVFSTYDNAGESIKDGSGVGFAMLSDGTLNTATGGLSGYEEGLYDNDAIAGLIVAGYEIRRGLYLEAGYGYTRTDLDAPGAEKDDCQTWYVQSTIFLAEGVFITPEVGGLDAKDDTQSDILYFGAKWQINF